MEATSSHQPPSHHSCTRQAAKLLVRLRTGQPALPGQPLAACSGSTQSDHAVLHKRQVGPGIIRLRHSAFTGSVARPPRPSCWLAEVIWLLPPPATDAVSVCLLQSHSQPNLWPRPQPRAGPNGSVARCAVAAARPHPPAQPKPRIPQPRPQHPPPPGHAPAPADAAVNCARTVAQTPYRTTPSTFAILLRVPPLCPLPTSAPTLFQPGPASVRTALPGRRPRGPQCRGLPGPPARLY
jgi:hypothetical protein